MHKTSMARWRASFLTGLVVVLPSVVALAVVQWLFGTFSSFTDSLLFSLPYWLGPNAMHPNGVSSSVPWYWNVLALLLAVSTIMAAGVLRRYYFGKQLSAWVDGVTLRGPILNKIYSLSGRWMKRSRPGKEVQSKRLSWWDVRQREFTQLVSSRTNEQMKSGIKWTKTESAFSSRRRRSRLESS